MNKAEKYLSERIDLMSDERIILLGKIDKADLEIKEIEYKIKDLKNSIDDTFEVFSPRTNKNDFIKSEIVCLEKEINNLTALREEYKEKAERISEDIDVIKDALGENIDENSEDVLKYECIDGLIFDNVEGNNIIFGVDYLNKNFKVNSGMLLHFISDIIHKCEICEKLVEVDTGRAKEEIEDIKVELNELYNNVSAVTENLKQTTDSRGESLKKISVKKLSKDNLQKGN